MSGADLANLFVPGLGASWEQEVYAGLGTTAAVVLALASLLVQRKKAAEFFRRHTHIVVAAVVLLVLDAVASMGNTVTFGGRTLFTVPIPQVLMDFWAMFSSCARLAWLAGMLLAVAACGLVLRFWNGAAAAVLLAVCAAAQGFGLRTELTKRYTTYHDAAYYEDTTQLTTRPGSSWLPAGSSAAWPLPASTLNTTTSGTSLPLPPTTAGPPTASTWATWTATWRR